MGELEAVYSLLPHRRKLSGLPGTHTSWAPHLQAACIPFPLPSPQATSAGGSVIKFIQLKTILLLFFPFWTISSTFHQAPKCRNHSRYEHACLPHSRTEGALGLRTPVSPRCPRSSGGAGSPHGNHLLCLKRHGRLSPRLSHVEILSEVSDVPFGRHSSFPFTASSLNTPPQF